MFIGNNQYMIYIFVGYSQVQLSEVIKVCKTSRSLAEAGRTLFNVSRDKKSSANDSHRVKQYLQKFGLTFQLINS